MSKCTLQFSPEFQNSYSNTVPSPFVFHLGFQIVEKKTSYFPCSALAHKLDVLIKRKSVIKSCLSVEGTVQTVGYVCCANVKQFY